MKFSIVETVSELSFVLLTEGASALPLELDATAVSSLGGDDRDALGGNVGGDDDVSDEEAVDSMLVMLAL